MTAQTKQRDSCLDAETIAAFVEGNLTRQEIAVVLAHLRHCTDCMAEVEALRPAAKKLPVRALATAAALIVLASGGLLLREQMRRDPMDRLIELAPRSARGVEPRLAHGFAWAPYRGPMRAQGGSGDAERLQLAGAAGDAVAHADRNAEDAGAQRTAGVALLLVERPDDAVARLRLATKQAPNDAQAWSDLGAALHEAGTRRGRASLLPEALEALDRALAIRADLPEALFNRALVLERLGLAQPAREAWQRYLAIDPSSQWATEAREHLARLPAQSSDKQFRGEQPRLEDAAARGDTTAVAAIVANHREQSRIFGEAEYLGRWGEAELRGDADAATRQLAIARALGSALVRLSGESLLAESVAAIDDSTSARRRQLADAHVTYRKGRIAYSRQSPAAAEGDLRRAAQLFGDAPMALVARYFAANTRFDRNDVTGARAELETLLAEALAHPRFVALAAHVRWELALCLMNDDDWSGTLPLVRDAVAAFRHLGEWNHCGFLETLHADVLVTLGRPDEAWAARMRSFELLSAHGRGDRLPVSIGGAVRMELRSGRLATARSLVRLERDAQRGIGNDVIATNALVRDAVLSAQLGDDGSAAALVREAAATAARIPDAALRARAEADVHFADGAVALRSEPRRAVELLGRAVDGYRAAEAPPFLAECHLLRARARLSLGDRDGARRDLDDGIAVHERHPLRFGEGIVGTGVLDAGTALYRDAIALALTRNDPAGAFAYAERALAQIGSVSPVAGLHDVQRRLAGSGAVLLEIIVLPKEVLAFCVTGEGAELHRQPVEEQELLALADAASSGDARASATLYDLLVRPSSPQLAAAREAIIVADPRMARVPFAALADASTKRTLIEQLPFSVAPSASALRRERRRDSPRSIVAVELAFDDEDAALPGASGELAEVRGFYGDATRFADEQVTFSAFVGAARNADVIHLAGHSGGEASAGEAVLLFGPPGQRERTSWRRLSTAALQRAPVVVLAACDTLHAPRGHSTRALSLGGAFLAAGAGDVIGTLTPIADNEARDFFRIVHRNLAAGAGASEAVRRAQLESIRDRRGTAWRSMAVLSTRIPQL